MEFYEGVKHTLGLGLEPRELSLLQISLRGIVVFVISRWRKHAMEPVAEVGDAAAIPQELLERARARAARETED